MLHQAPAASDPAWTGLQVLFVDEKSRSFVKENHNCDFYISSDESSSGVLENPKHSLPPNTTCRYHFQGKPNEIVWLSFVKYYAASVDAPAGIDVASDCNAKLLIWDGDHTLDKLVSARKVRIPLFFFPAGSTPCLGTFGTESTAVSTRRILV